MGKLKSIEHGIKAAVFRLFQPTLKRKRKDFTAIDGNSISRVLFLRPEKIGDMVISFPVFDGLKERYPHLKISILGSPRSYTIIKDDPRFDKVFLYRKNLRDLPEMASMRREKYDCVVDMICDDSVTALFLSQLAAPGRPRIGVGKVKFRDYYDYNYDHRMGNTGHIIDNTLKLLEAFGIDSDRVSRYASPHVAKSDTTEAEKFLGTIADGHQDALTIGLNLSAGSITRVWEDSKCREFIHCILSTYQNCRVVILTVGQDRARGEALVGGFDSSVYHVPPGLSLTGAAALISQLDLLVTPDTSLVHIARAFKVPVVGLYTQFMKNFLLWRPYGQEVGAVVSGNDYNVHDITVDQVLAAFTQVVDGHCGVRG